MAKSLFAPNKATGFIGAPPPAPSRYQSWGTLATMAQKQGWRPASWDANTTTFINPYDTGINGVVIPGEKDLGHVAVIGSNKGSAFKIVIRDAKGNEKKIVGENLTPDQVQQYFTGQKSTVAQRNNSIIAGTNHDRPDAQGNYTALK